ncbi:MAG TPA: cache domain-containing protein [Patescibacteria group bacterium]|nr:cache domain-containing protein [Patescibacteria group bacterium]
MIESQFLLQNAHFALNLFAALVFFSAAWLYFDAWVLRKELKETLKILGLFLLCLSFLTHATFIEQTILVNPLIGTNIIVGISLLLRIVGYGILAAGLLIDPLQKRPDETAHKTFAAGAFASPGFGSLFSALLSPILAAFTGLLYLKRATKGLEHHLRPVALSFFLLSIHELLSLASLFQNTNNITLFNLVSPFGLLWTIEHLFLLAAIIVLGKWVFAYLLKRLQTQLFIILTSLILLIFLLTTISFTYLLLRNLENDALAHLTTDVNILAYSIESKKSELVSDAEVAAANPVLKEAINTNDRKALKDIATNFLLAKKESFLVITAANGTVLMRGEDPESFGDSLSNDPLYRKAAKQERVSSVVVRDGVLAPTVSVRGAVPVLENETVIGTVILGTDIDNTYVDGIKKATKLDASIYGGNKRSATTFISADKKSRWVGIAEETPEIKKTVLVEGKPYVGTSTILSVPYLSAFLPLKDVDNIPVGMLFVGKEKLEVLQTAGRSIELTFLVSAILLIISIFPAFLIAKFISRQIK